MIKIRNPWGMKGVSYSWNEKKKEIFRKSVCQECVPMIWLKCQMAYDRINPVRACTDL